MKKILAAAAALFSLMACQPNASEELAEKIAPRFYGQIEEVSTRVNGTQWVLLEGIGISCASGGVDYTNYWYIFSASNRFEPMNKAIYFHSNDEVIFSAYYPYTDDSYIENNLQQINTTNQNNMPDVLFAQAKGSAANPDVHFHFKHVMSQLTLSIKPGEGIEFSKNPVTSITLKGLKHSGTFNILSGEVAINAEAEVEDVVYDGENWTYSNSCAFKIMPQEANEVCLEIVAGGKSYVTTPLQFPDGKLEAGKNYCFDVTVSLTAISVSNAAVAEWVDAGTEEVTSRQV